MEGCEKEECIKIPPHYGLILVIIIVLIVIVCYHQFLKRIYGSSDYRDYDLLQINLIEFPGENNNVNLWKLSHVLFYFVLGWYFPQYWKIVIIIGILWEIIEISAGVLTKNKWWYGCASDILANVFGFAMGVTLRSISM